MFSDAFMKKCRDNEDVAQFIPLEMKNNINRNLMEHVLYTQEVKLRQKYLKFVATDRNKNEAKFKFQGQSARSQRWFDIDFDYIEVNFSTLEPDLYKKLFQRHDDTQDTNTYKSFQVPIGNAKCVETFKFHNDAPILKYSPKSLNSCCFICLAPAFDNINHNKAAYATSLRIEESLESEVGNRIDFANSILKNEKKGEHKIYYILMKYKKKGSYDILKDTSENVTLIQLID